MLCTPRRFLSTTWDEIAPHPELSGAPEAVAGIEAHLRHSPEPPPVRYKPLQRVLAFVLHVAIDRTGWIGRWKVPAE